MKRQAAVRASSSETSSDVSADVRAQVVNPLNQRLAETLDLDAETKRALWNGKGPHSIALLKRLLGHDS